MRLCERINDNEQCRREAKWNPVLLVYAPAKLGNHTPAQITIGVAVCSGCKDATVLEDVMTDEGWSRICKKFKSEGKVEPDLSRTQLSWAALRRLDGELASGSAYPVPRLQ